MREIGFLQVYTGYLTFSLKNPGKGELRFPVIAAQY